MKRRYEDSHRDAIQAKLNLEKVEYNPKVCCCLFVCLFGWLVVYLYTIFVCLSSCLLIVYSQVTKDAVDKARLLVTTKDRTLAENKDQYQLFIDKFNKSQKVYSYSNTSHTYLSLPNRNITTNKCLWYLRNSLKWNRAELPA